MELTTTRDVAAALEGTAGLRKLLPADEAGKLVSYQLVWSWHAQNKFPAKFYLLMTQALAEKGYSAPPSLWGVLEVEQTS